MHSSEDLMIDLAKKAEEVFFIGMRKGYAFGNKAHRTTVSASCAVGNTDDVFKGWEQISVVHEGWVLVDRWGSDGGHTMIYQPFSSIPVWMMRYFGSYPKNAMALLKAALADRYSAGEFCGGRGPHSYAFGTSERGPDHDCVLTYANNWEGNFSKFNGSESIQARETYDSGIVILKPSGSHSYWGGLLV